MNVIEALSARYSARAYKPDPVSREILEKVLEAGLKSPSWANTQPWDIYVAAGDALDRVRVAFGEKAEQGVPSNPDIPRPAGWPAAIQKRMVAGRAAPVTPAAPATPAPAAQSEEEARKAMAIRGAKLFGAPVVIYLCMDRSLTAYSVYDIGLLSQSIMLAAKEYGLDTIPAVSLVGYPDVLHKELGVPDELEFVLGLALGYATEEAAARPRSKRAALADVVHFCGI